MKAQEGIIGAPAHEDQCSSVGSRGQPLRTVRERAGFPKWVSSGLFSAIITSSFSAPDHYILSMGFLSYSQNPARTSPTCGPSARPAPPSPARSGSVTHSRMSLGYSKTLTCVHPRLPNYPFSPILSFSSH